MIKLFNTKKEIKLNKFIGRGGRFLILREAKKRKINCQVLIQKGRKKEDEDVLFIRFEKNGKKRWLSPQRGYFNPKQACELALFKDLTYQILKSVNIPIPNYRKIEKIRDLKKMEIKFPLVIKPIAQAKGKDVLIGIDNEIRLKKSLRKLLKKYSSLLVEEFIPGNDYRLLILDNKLIGAVQRIQPKVKGNGKKTIRELIKRSNRKREEEPKEFRPFLKNLEIDQGMRQCLRKQGYTLKSILEEDKIISVRQNANFTTGGEIRDVTDKIHPDNIKIAKKAVQSLGLKLGGVDITTQDISQSILENEGRVLEVNGIPGIWIHHFPHKGKKRNISRKIIDYLFKE